MTSKIKVSPGKVFAFLLLWELFFNSVNGVRVPPTIFWPFFVVLLFVYWLGFNKRKLFFPKKTAFVAASLIYILVSGVFAGIGSAYNSFYFVFRITLYFLSTVMVMNFVKDYSDWVLFVSKVSFALALFHAFFVYLSYLAPSVFFAIDIQGSEHVQMVRTFMQRGSYIGLTSQSSSTALPLVVGLAFSLYLYQFYKHGKKTWWVLVGQIILVTSIFLTQRRLTTGLAFVCMAYEFLFFFNGKLKLLGVLFLTLFLFFFGWEAIPGLSSVVGKMTSHIDSNDVINGRGILWANAFRLFWESPVIGGGWNSYYARFGASDAHNSILQVFGELGFAGAFLYFGYHIYCAILFLKLCSWKHFDKGIKAISFCVFCIFCITGFFEHYFLDTETLCYLYIVEMMIQLEWRKYKRQRKERSHLIIQECTGRKCDYATH